MKKVVCISLLICFLGSSVFSVNEKDIDSLLLRLNTSKEVDQLPVLIELSKQYGYNSFVLSYKYAKMAELIAIKYKKEKDLINIYRILGASKQYQFQLDSAIYYYEKSIFYSKKIGDHKEIAKSQSNLGSIYAQDKQFDKAEEIYLVTLKSLDELKDSSSVKQLYNNLGMLYRLKHDYKKSIEFYSKAMGSIDTLGVEYAIQQSNIAEVYFLTNDIQTAIKLYLSSVQIFEKNDSKYNLAFTYFRIAKLYFVTHQIEKAKLYGINSISIAKDINALDILLHSNKLMFNIERTNKDLELALRYNDAYLVINDSINDMKRTKLLNELKIKYEVELKNVEIENKNIEISRMNSFLVLLISAVFLFIVLSLFLFILLRKNKKAQLDLVLQNLNFVTAEEELLELKQERMLMEDRSFRNTPENSLLIDQILDLVQNKKIYLEPDLTIFKFADEINTNKTYVSTEINNKFKMNFNNFINKYRVSEARRLMSMPENSNYTLAALAIKSGFNSISVFNRAFKKETGVTPSFYLKSVNNLGFD